MAGRSLSQVKRGRWVFCADGVRHRSPMPRAVAAPAPLHMSSRTDGSMGAGWEVERGEHRLGSWGARSPRARRYLRKATRRSCPNPPNGAGLRFVQEILFAPGKKLDPVCMGPSVAGRRRSFSTVGVRFVPKDRQLTIIATVIAIERWLPEIPPDCCGQLNREVRENAAPWHRRR